MARAVDATGFEVTQKPLKLGDIILIVRFFVLVIATGSCCALAGVETAAGTRESELVVFFLLALTALALQRAWYALGQLDPAGQETIPVEPAEP